MKFKRKKNSRQRGTHTHGWGSKKKHRGAGNRGGRGKAGSGKRGDAKKPSFWKNKKYLGKHGFKPVRPKKLAINVGELDRHIEIFVGKNQAKLVGGAYEIDLDKLRIEKLIGTGNTVKVFKITVKKASEKAIEKIKKAKGVVNLLPKPAKPVAQEKPEKKEKTADEKQEKPE